MGLGQYVSAIACVYWNHQPPDWTGIECPLQKYKEQEIQDKSKTRQEKKPNATQVHSVGVEGTEVPLGKDSPDPKTRNIAIWLENNCKSGGPLGLDNMVRQSFMKPTLEGKMVRNIFRTSLVLLNLR